jgi:methionyl-tRNA formyltransferase
MNGKIKFAFFGTPDVAAETLEILKQAGFLPALVVTSPDAKRGRGLHMQASPVAVFAEKNNILCLKPDSLKGGLDIVFKNIAQTDGSSIAINQQIDMRVLKNNIQPDLFIVVAYGKIMPEKIINMPKLGSINIHYSLLPKWRGASPVESAILNGDTETGVTIQKMAFEMDSGPIIAQEKITIFPDEKALNLRKRLIKIGGELLVKTLQTPSFLPLDKGEVPKAVGVKQDESQATFCKKIKKEDGLIDLKDDAVVNYNKFRAYAYWPRTFFFQNNKRIIITGAEFQDGKFVIRKVLPEGKKEIKYEDFIKTNIST